MYILAFETSCDDTSVALFEDNKLIAMDTASQIKLHNITGGVVPEVAARQHANSIFTVLENVLAQANFSIPLPKAEGKDSSFRQNEILKILEKIDYIAVTKTPGLMPSLLTGLTVARTLANILNKPLIEINHIQAHIFANFLDRKQQDIKYPLACLTVSGGHNEIYYMKDMWDFEKIGATTDDSAGEAFDKVAKMMGLGYPGGPIISKLASEYSFDQTSPHSVSPKGREENKKRANSNLSLEVEEVVQKKSLFPRVWLEKDSFNFSFSGLKSAVKREVDKRGKLSLDDKKEIAYEFENAVVEVLAYKLVNAALKKKTKTIMLAGGVSANDKLVDTINNMAKKQSLDFIYPTKKLFCGDNAAMVGMNAYYKIKETL